MTKLFNLLLVSLLAIACNTGAEKENEEKDNIKILSKEVCDCLTPLTETMSPEAKKIFKEALESNDVEKTTEDELQKLDEDKRIKVSAEIEVIGNAMQSEDSQVSKCLNKVTEKYKDNKTDDPEAAVKKLISSMEDQKNCELGASIFKAYLAKGMNETESEDSDDKGDDGPGESEERSNENKK